MLTAELLFLVRKRSCVVDREKPINHTENNIYHNTFTAVTVLVPVQRVVCDISDTIKLNTKGNKE